MPVFIKVFFGLFIDTKVIKSRAIIIILFGINSVIMQALICFVPRLSETVVLILLSLLTLGTAILDATIDSIKTEQARCHKNG